MTVKTKQDKIVRLAPMAGDGDRSFRLICKRHGAEYLCTEMVSAKAICYNDKKTPLLADLTSEELPAAVQLFGHEPEYIHDAVKSLIRRAEESGVMMSAFDINMGCPMHKIVSNGDGAALMKTPAVAAEVIRAAVNAAGDIPVTVKMRLGWDRSSINVIEMAKIAEGCGAKEICVHARTRADLYSPGTLREYIGKVKQAVGITVIGNGDIMCADDAISMMKETGCDGVAIARGALGNPWIFDEIRARLDGSEFMQPTVRERIDEAMLQLRMSTSHKGEYTAIVEARKYLPRYIKCVRGSSAARRELNGAKTAEEIESILNSLTEYQN